MTATLTAKFFMIGSSPSPTAGRGRAAPVWIRSPNPSTSYRSDRNAERRWRRSSQKPHDARERECQRKHERDREDDVAPRIGFEFPHPPLIDEVEDDGDRDRRQQQVADHGNDGFEQR